MDENFKDELKELCEENDSLRKENTFLKQQLIKIKICCENVSKYTY